MNWRIALLLLALLSFGVLSLYAMYEVGYLGIWRAGVANWGAAQVLVDLVIACGLIAVWIVGDARRHGLSPWPYVFITLVAGSFGPLLYLLRREWKGAAVLRPAAG